MQYYNKYVVHKCTKQGPNKIYSQIALGGFGSSYYRGVRRTIDELSNTNLPIAYVHIIPNLFQFELILIQSPLEVEHGLSHTSILTHQRDQIAVRLELKCGRMRSR